MSQNQNPEQKARDLIDKKLEAAGWKVGKFRQVNVLSHKGVAVCEYPTESGGFADYALFVDGKPVGIIEAKKAEEGFRINQVHQQSSDYARGKLKFLNHAPLPFIYESTGIITRFADYRDPKPRSRDVFSFHQPETFEEWLRQGRSLRDRLQDLPALDPTGLRPAQVVAIENLEKSFKNNRPKALIQMATGAGKTFAATTFVYRLLKHTNAKRILFLVDTRNLGEQAEQAFRNYQPRDDNRKFVELYNPQRLSSQYIAPDSQVCISTIQRLYSILQGAEMHDQLEDENPNERTWNPKEPMPVVYNPKVPIDQFDFVIVDECHRSIYNLWKQVIDYFDAFLIGLTATPDKRTFGFFDENVVSEYTYEQSVADGVNVPHDIFLIDTRITQQGAELKANEYVDRRARRTHAKRWAQLDEDVVYSGNQLDRDIVNTSQIRTILRTFRNSWPLWFPDRDEIPKTLIFAKSDNHAKDIIKEVLLEFGEGNDFCKKITYRSEENPKSILTQFRNKFMPRIAVTVDMVATGTDIKPLEILLFMRDVRSTGYFEQMKGRGTRTITLDDLRQASPSAKHAKTHFVVVDAVGVTKSRKTDSRPLERKRTKPLKDLLTAVAVGATSEDLFLSLANRLVRIGQQINDEQKEKFKELAEGKTLQQVVGGLLRAYDPDALEERTMALQAENPGAPEEEIHDAAQMELAREAAQVFSGELNEYIENVRRILEQIIDHINLDEVTRAEWDAVSVEQAKEVVADFSSYIEANKDEITALRLFYGQPYQRRELTFRMVKEVIEKLRVDKPKLAPAYVWEAYRQLEEVQEGAPKSELVALVSLIRRVTGLDETLTPYDKAVDRKFQSWVFQKQAGKVKFNKEQMDWLHMLKEHIAGSFHVDRDDLDYAPFDAQGGVGQMYELFGDEMEGLMGELNEALAA